jgi:SHS2 domain-containing protein
MRYRLPSPFTELAHTADAGLEAAGGDLAETLARAALGMSQLLAGGGSVDPVEEREVVARGEDRASLLVDLCRCVLQCFFLERLLLAELEVESASETEVRARGWFGPFDPERHAEGMDIKAVTYGQAALEPVEGGGFRARLIFDI